MINHCHNKEVSIKGSNASVFALPNLLYGLNFGAFAALVNIFFTITVLSNVIVFFGQIFVLLCLVTRGLNAAIVSALIAATAAALHAQDAYLIIVFPLEILIVHMLLSRGVLLFQSAAFFWLFIGSPLIIILHALTTVSSVESFIIKGIVMGINALVCLSVASIIYWFLPRSYTYIRYHAQPPKLASLIFSLCLITVTLPTLVVASYFILQTTGSNEQAVSNSLHNAVKQVTAINKAEIENHLTGLSALASLSRNTQSLLVQNALNNSLEHYPLYTNIRISDKYGNITYTATHNTYLNHSAYFQRPNIRQSEYFQTTKNTLASTVSDGLAGKTIRDEHHIRLSVPITKNGEFTGLVEGFISLRKLALYHQSRLLDKYLFVITDSKGRIISRSETLNYPFLSNFDYQRETDSLIPNTPLLSINHTRYIYNQDNGPYGWKITVLERPNKITDVLFEFFMLLTLLTFLLIAALGVIANALAKKITRPFVDITKKFPDPKGIPQIMAKSQLSSEMLALTHKLLDSHNAMSNFQQQLSEQVNSKTKQLKELNKELYALAQKDALTQLLNRAGFDKLALTSYRNCIRHHIPVSLILLDIDHFKNINDSYGHPFGDKCIIASAKAIQQHCKRDTDILGRYGGEEFIIMISGGEVTEHLERVAMIKEHIQALQFKSGDHNVCMTISAGVCSLVKTFTVTYEELIKQADEQLYVSKNQGRNKISSIIR